MNNILKASIAVLSLIIQACAQDDKITNSCTVRQSAKVDEGRFNAEDIVAIGLVRDNQASLYPIPEWSKEQNMILVKDPRFIKEFKTRITMLSNKGIVSRPKDFNSIHILIMFKSGENACLFGRLRPAGFLIGPMFSRDAYHGLNNGLYELILSKIYATGAVQNN